MIAIFLFKITGKVPTGVLNFVSRFFLKKDTYNYDRKRYFTSTQQCAGT
jgi:hypothetical protein